MIANRVRLYGKKVSKWMHEDERGRNVCYQFEMEYKEYSVENGTLVGEGTEDFSTERYRQEIITKLVWTWDGKKRNKGGHRWFEFLGYVEFAKRDKKLVQECLKNKYKGTEEIQLR